MSTVLDLWRDANINRAEGLEVTNRETGVQSIVPHFDSSLINSSEQNEEEREHQMALTQLRGEQALALQRVANEGSGTASVGASSGVSSLGGSFHTA